MLAPPGASGGSKDHFDGRSESPPALRLLSQGAPAGRGEAVKARASIALRRPPFARDEPLVLEALQRRVERALVHLERTVGDLLDALADPPSMHGGERERLQNEHLDRAAEDIGLW